MKILLEKRLKISSTVLLWTVSYSNSKLKLEIAGNKDFELKLAIILFNKTKLAKIIMTYKILYFFSYKGVKFVNIYC